MATAPGRCRKERSAALGSGVYGVLATGINSAGIMAFDSTVNQLSIDTTSPTVAIVSPTTSAGSPVNSIAIQFSEPVENFSLQDLQLTLTYSGASASEPLEGTTLTTTDNQNWTLGNLAGVTSRSRHIYPDARRHGMANHRYVGQSALDHDQPCRVLEQRPHGGHAGQCQSQPGDRHDDRAFGAGSRPRYGRIEPDLQLGGDDAAHRAAMLRSAPTATTRRRTPRPRSARRELTPSR